MKVGDWYHSLDHNEPGRVVALDSLWRQATCVLWLPCRGTTVRVLQQRLQPLQTDCTGLLHRLSYIGAATRIVNALEREALAAPLEGTAIPLPHQLYALQRAMSGDRIRYLLADEVGLGKTIEAGLILRELKFRGLARRILVVAPSGLVNQWVSEMKTHFNEDFRLLLPSQLSALRNAGGVGDADNLWRLHQQVVCPLDSVKPLEARRGWSNERLASYNRERFEDLVSAGWDLVIIDEAHRLGGSSDHVARFKLGEALAQAAPYLLLLSATPHQGKSDAFRRLVGFLDADALPTSDDISREIVAPFVIRTEKRRAIDAEGNPLFKPRFTQLVGIEWSSGHQEQRALYESVTEYVRDGYNKAMSEKQTAVGFLMILFQRLVTSSTAAIRTALEKRLELLDLPPGQFSLFSEDIAEEWSALDGQEQLDTVLKARLKGLKDERKEVELLLSVARRCEAMSPDLKAMALLNLIQKLQREENSPLLKILVFTEFVPSQKMLANFLGQRGFTVGCLNGSLDLDERREVQRHFATDTQVLVSTDAGGEGLNLQFCHVVVNYDLPWNPMKIEQRIGRVDRIGQKHVVRALNFVLADTVEWRIREVLEAKLQKILEEFGVDKLADVLDSEEGDVPFEALFVNAVLAPESAKKCAEELVAQIRQRAEGSHVGAQLLSPVGPLDPAAAQHVAAHQMPFWTERLTLAYLASRERDGASVFKGDVGYDLRWPDGTQVQSAVFARQEREQPGATCLSLEDERIRGIITSLPVFVAGQPVPGLIIPEVSQKISGTWSLWGVRLHVANGHRRRFFAVFVASDGRVLAPTARKIWEILIELGENVESTSELLDGDAASEVYRVARGAAEAQGAPLFDELVTHHCEALERERKKGSHAFDARRLAIERIGLPQVREWRLRQLAEEEGEWKAEMAVNEAILPELICVTVARIEPRENPA